MPSPPLANAATATVSGGVSSDSKHESNASPQKDREGVAHDSSSAFTAADVKHPASAGAPISAGAGAGASAVGKEGEATPASAVVADAQASTDFHLSYSQTQQTLPTLIKARLSLTASFLYVMPNFFLWCVGGHTRWRWHFYTFRDPSLPRYPGATDDSFFFSRSLVFLLDRSGSMAGEPFLESQRALQTALSTLRSSDHFTVALVTTSQASSHPEQTNTTTTTMPT